MVRPDPVVGWLMDGDPAVRWQVMRDLLDAPARAWRAQQKQVATAGWGRLLLDRQRENGNWGRGPYQPKWTCTTYTMQQLWKLGLPARDPAALRACAVYTGQGLHPDGGINFWGVRRKASETCVTGMILGQLSWFEGAPLAVLDAMVARLLAQQMEDGGWNCQRDNGARVGSFHTTQSALEGLQAYVDRRGAKAGTVVRALARGREYFLAHRLYKSQRTGRVALAQATLFHFPDHWRFDVLRGLDHFCQSGVPPDPRLQDAVELVRSRRRQDGRWSTAAAYQGAMFFTPEKAGVPGRWNTLRALRVLRWWGAGC